MGKKRVNKVFQIVSEKEVLLPWAKVHSQDSAISTMRHEMKRLGAVTCGNCKVQNPVVREVTIRRVKL